LLSLVMHLSVDVTEDAHADYGLTVPTIIK